jgi:hypothetical protein
VSLALDCEDWKCDGGAADSPCEWLILPSAASVDADALEIAGPWCPNTKPSISTLSRRVSDMECTFVVDVVGFRYYDGFGYASVERRGHWPYLIHGYRFVGCCT